MMRVISGWGFLDEVARDPSLRQIPIGVRTAAEHGKLTGAAAVLSRPTDLTALLRSVGRCVRGEQHAGS
jgi:CheY-like chemotaxis protein